ncbi:putative mannose-6-phosphate isomerase GmuF [Rosistilla carotiformis]|uniref:Putative mannose-6-phosphate isomerase GmuF n=1 Tax=Rosistilla carotiformis TaxID=2528017 RepID=A0A518K122_9BACT|nr:type I phosphomannose isomerase catalytic subunit [Rosistilla carotiformis]QDV71493.1 putative mannose-6-phosphate isomerase GmuF [Rosistilla carotiformis]
MHAPLRFQPLFREYIWGARRLGSVLGKPIGDAPRYAESWEIVDHGADQSIVAEGPLAGRSLSELLRTSAADLLGPELVCNRFPLLLKYLDCDRVLSVQVHPDDTYAQKMTPPDLGKTEAWYIIAAEPGSLIYAGLKQGVGPEELRAACAAGRTDDVLHTLQPSAGDCVFIPAGTVHALGSGLLVAEIQQSSDTTFRLFDWNRVDDTGNARPLHVSQAIEVTDYDRGPVDFQTPQDLASGGQRLVGCDKFFLDRFGGTAATEVGGDNRFRILTVVAGQATIAWGDGNSMALPLGQTALIPAAVGQVTLTGSDPESVVLCMGMP